jgi:hypothetical protein
MALSDFLNLKKISYGDDDHWVIGVNEHGQATRTASEADSVTISYMTTPPPAETIPCPTGTVVTITGSGSASVKTP